jgi:oligoendopeptidase F
MLFAQREQDFLNSEKLQELMILAQSESYGEGLDPATYNPYMWLCKGHYYSASNNFYNFPYAFGGLFALGLYAQYEIEKEAFVPKYQNLLKATAKSSCEDVGKLAGIDTTDVGFWKQSIDQIIKRIDLYMELTEK